MKTSSCTFGRIDLQTYKPGTTPPSKHHIQRLEIFVCHPGTGRGVPPEKKMQKTFRTAPWEILASVRKEKKKNAREHLSCV